MKKSHFDTEIHKRGRNHGKKQKIILLIVIFALAIAVSQKSYNPTNNILSLYRYSYPSDMATPFKTMKGIAKVYTRSDGTIVVNEQPFFLFGLYHDWIFVDKKKRLQELISIADAGFNVILTDSGDNDESDLDVLDEAQRLGIYCMGHYYHRKIDNQKFLDIVNKYKNKPALLGWNIADDVDYPSNHYEPQKVLELHEKTKAVDKNHLTYITGFSERIRHYINSADIVGFESYPVSNDPNEKKPLRRNYYNMVTGTKYEDGTPYNRTIIANLQTFPWKNSRSPTSKEIYNMTYGALINGVKGILYYSYSINDNKWDLSQDKDLWNGIKSLVPEIKKLSPVLLEGKLTKLDTNTVDDLYAGQWTYRNSVYVVVLNTSPADTIKASFTVPAKAKGPAQPLFPGRPSGMFFQGGKLHGSIKPGDVHVYQLSRG
jgi:hypothetical protein